MFAKKPKRFWLSLTTFAANSLDFRAKARPFSPPSSVSPLVREIMLVSMPCLSISSMALVGVQDPKTPRPPGRS